MTTEPDNSYPPTSTPIFLDGLSGELFGNDYERSPLFFLHGLTFNRLIWDPVLKEIRRLEPNRRILAIDLPGHGQSNPMTSYDMVSLTDHLHDMVEQLNLGAPVIVGHSIAAIIATVYAARFPTRGIVNVDQSLHTLPFAEMLHTMKDRLRSPAFASIWPLFAQSFHAELLPPPGQNLVRSTSDPRQEIVLGYWQEVLDQPPADLASYIDTTLTAVSRRQVPYLVIAGKEPEPGYVTWLQESLPQATIIVLPYSGHFPHLAHPLRFAELVLERY